MAARFHKSAVIVFLLCGFCVCKADAEEIFTWEDCAREAAAHNPELISAAEDVMQAKADKAIVRSAGLPQLGSSASRKKTKAATSDPKDSYSYSLSAQQLLFDGFKLSNDVWAAKKTLSAQEYNLAVVSSDVRLNLRTAFASLLRAQELISLTDEIAARRKQNLELVQLRYNAGREHSGALLTAKADLAQAEFEVAQAERNLLLTQRTLLKEMGHQLFVALNARGDFAITENDAEKPDFDTLVDTTPFLKRLVAQKEAARYDYAAAKADFFPKVYLDGGFGQSAASWPPNQDDWSAGVSVSFPLFEGGSRIAQASKAKSQLRQAQADERSGRDSVIVTLEQAWKQFRDAIDTVAVKEKFLRAAQERAQIANAQYSTGLISFNDWIIIEDNLVNAKKAFLDAQANLLIAEAGWVQAKGGTLEYAKQ